MSLVWAHIYPAHAKTAKVQQVWEKVAVGMKDLDFPQAHWMSYRLREVLLRDLETLPPLTTKDGGDVRLLLMQAIDLVESHEYETIEWAKKAIQLRAVLNEHTKGGEQA